MISFLVESELHVKVRAGIKVYRVETNGSRKLTKRLARTYHVKLYLGSFFDVIVDDLCVKPIADPNTFFQFQMPKWIRGIRPLNSKERRLEVLILVLHVGVHGFGRFCRDRSNVLHHRLRASFGDWRYMLGTANHRED